MAKKRRAGAGGRAAAATPAAAPAAPAVGAPRALPPEPAADGWASTLLALMMFLAPGLGFPGEEMLQDTLKSVIVSFFTLAATGLFLLAQKNRVEPLRWHAVVWLPLLLCAYALGSMAWSHAYLAGVEAVRWFVFTVIAWLGLNTLTRDRLGVLATCIHGGALAAALWAAVQFWTGASLFPQGANPASTFINRNFFAEFVVCTLPFSALILARARRSGSIVLMSAFIGFIVTTILMTGTRAALMALWLQLLLVLPLLAWRCRAQLAWPQWPAAWRLLAPLVMLGTVLALGFIPSNNQNILQEGHGTNALERGFQRTQSIGPTDYSLGVRMLMWKATGNMIRARPLSGVGAGAWENDVPLYQAEGSQLETDYYVHNEFLQLVAEYGLVGWAFLLLLFAYLLQAAWRSWNPRTAEAAADQPWRGALLCSLLALFLVSNIGFPWRMAATGALFALCLGGLAASDARLGFTARWLAWPLRWSPMASRVALAATAACLVLAVVITQRATEAERKLVTAVRLALSVTASGNPRDPRLEPTRSEILRLVREGIALNPHYRKITPMVGDELARWGDWENATWIWESVIGSRPNIVAIIGNAARGHSNMGRHEQAQALLERAQRIQPNAPTVRSLEVLLLARSGQEARALAAAKAAMAADIVDYDLANALFVLSWRAKDYALARQAMARRIAGWPASNAEGLLQLGRMTAEEHNDPAQAIDYYRRGLAAASPAQRQALVQLVPQDVRAQVLAQP
ncbi:O-antigen ligase family protein [Ramlibacter sp. PS3R-8]|uniref:O-antigen ligase family protein n=1 Tax=Ramlibacter sp. PS3R-8 TaxID=3133437 RepID=UPI0030B136F1